MPNLEGFFQQMARRRETLLVVVMHGAKRFTQFHVVADLLVDRDPHGVVNGVLDALAPAPSNIAASPTCSVAMRVT